MNYAILGNEKNFTVFKYGNRIIRFKAPYSLEKYTEIKEWDHGYLVVMAKYKHNKESEEEYIDLISILEKFIYFTRRMATICSRLQKRNRTYI